MIAYTILAVTTTRSRAVIPRERRKRTHPARPPRTAHPAASLVLTQPRRDLAHVLHWSQWRRRHQHRAAACHRHWNEVAAR